MSDIDVPNCRSQKLRETDMFSKTVSSRDAATEPTGMYLRRVLVNIAASRTKPSDMALGVAQIRAGIQQEGFSRTFKDTFAACRVNRRFGH